jgi:hypothetical protein
MLPPLPVRDVMKHGALSAVVLSLLMTASGDRASIRFEPTGDARSVIADWKAAGLACDNPHAGFPGP